MPTPRFKKIRTVIRSIIDISIRPQVDPLALLFILWLWGNHVSPLSWTFWGAISIYLVICAALKALREVAADDRIWTKYY